MAGRQGLEPRYADPESAVLPLDDLPRGRTQPIITAAFIGKCEAFASTRGAFSGAVPRALPARRLANEKSLAWREAFGNVQLDGRGLALAEVDAFPAGRSPTPAVLQARRSK